MKNWIIKLLGLNTLVAEVLRLKKENENLNKALADLEEVVADLETKVDAIKAEVEEIPEFDADDFVREDDVNDRIESFLNDHDYCSSSYVDDEIESKVSDKMEEAIGELDIDELVEIKVADAIKAVDAGLLDKVKEAVDDMDKASFGDTEEMRSEIIRQLRIMLNNEVELKISIK